METRRRILGRLIIFVEEFQFCIAVSSILSFSNSQGSAARTPHSLSHEPGFLSTGPSPPASLFPSTIHIIDFTYQEEISHYPSNP